MPNFRRWRQPGGTYFFTVNLRDPRQRLLVDRIDQLRQAIAHVRRVRPHASIHRLIERGVLDQHWGTDGIQSNLDLD